MPDISKALKLLSQPIEYIIKLYEKDCQDKLAYLRAENNLKILYGKLNLTQKVKTIWNNDRPIAINSFYYPAKIKVSPRKAAVIDAIDDIEGNAIVLQGIVGQGKSILLRYLHGKEMRSGKRVPLFVELRHTSPNGLEEYIHTRFNELMGTELHPQVFGLFAKEGKVSLLLDGFDEVDVALIPELIQRIEQLAQRFPNAKIIVSSRPGSGIETSPSFTVKQIAPLGEDDYWGFFNKVLGNDTILVSRIYHALTSPTSRIKGLVNTPLLATLLTIIYRANQKIPSDFSEFYDELFQILLVRHDRAKPGYERKRKTKLNDRAMQQGFEAYCFKIKAQFVSPVSRSNALVIASEAMKSLDLQADEGCFLDDIMKITCLLQEEGGQVEFLHQSIQEYYAAKYISSRPENVAIKFYELVLDEAKRQKWDQVLRFLQQIDEYRSSKYFFIPAILNTLTYLESLDFIASADRIRELITDKIGVVQLIGTEEGGRSISYRVDSKEAFHFYRLNEITELIFALLFRTTASKKNKWRACFDGFTHEQFFSYTEIAVYCGTIESVDRKLQEGVKSIKKNLEFHQDRIKTLNHSVEFMGF
ncbi:MAG: NACHT domain-containing protein [Cyanobacteriota bacterium]|jgi:hypothetical protein